MTSPLNWDIKSERKQEAQRRCSAALVTARPCAARPLPRSTNHRPEPRADTCDLPALPHASARAADAQGMLGQKPCGKSLLQPPPGKPTAHRVERGADLTPRLVQNNMRLFQRNPARFWGARRTQAQPRGSVPAPVPSLSPSLIPVKSHPGPHMASDHSFKDENTE